METDLTPRFFTRPRTTIGPLKNADPSPSLPADQRTPSTSSGRAGAPRRCPPLAIVVSRYNASITDRHLSGAVRAYQLAGGNAPDLYIIEAPGAFELVALSSAAAESHKFRGVLAIGCIIKGETRHDEVLGHDVTQGLANISLITGVPVGLAVLTVNTAKQAAARAGGSLGNKGAQAMDALLQTAAEIDVLEDDDALQARWQSPANLVRMMHHEPFARPDKAATPARRAASAKPRTRKGGR